MSCHSPVLQPRHCRNNAGLGYSRFARHYFGNHFCFLLLRVLRCFSSPRLPSANNGMIHSSRIGLPHSEIRGSIRICQSPRLIAAYHVLRRLPEPRHPPCALMYFIFSLFVPSVPHRPNFPKGKNEPAVAGLDKYLAFCYLLFSCSFYFYFIMSKIASKGKRLTRTPFDSRLIRSRTVEHCPRRTSNLNMFPQISRPRLSCRQGPHHSTYCSSLSSPAARRLTSKWRITASNS